MNDLSKINIAAMTLARRTITDPGEGTRDKLKNPPSINHLITFADEKCETTYLTFCRLEDAGLATHNTLPTSAFNVTETVWSLTAKCIAWVFYCDEAYKEYLRYQKLAAKAKKNLIHLQEEFNDSREETKNEAEAQTEDADS